MISVSVVGNCVRSTGGQHVPNFMLDFQFRYSICAFIFKVERKDNLQSIVKVKFRICFDAVRIVIHAITLREDDWT